MPLIGKIVFTNPVTFIHSRTFINWWQVAFYGAFFSFTEETPPIAHLAILSVGSGSSS